MQAVQQGRAVNNERLRDLLEDPPARHSQVAARMWSSRPRESFFESRYLPHDALHLLGYSTSVVDFEVVDVRRQASGLTLLSGHLSPFKECKGSDGRKSNTEGPHTPLLRRK